MKNEVLEVILAQGQHVAATAGKTWEYYAALAGAALYMLRAQAVEEPLWAKYKKVASSGLLTIGLSGSVAPYLWDQEVLAAVVVMVAGHIVLDVFTALIADREWVKSIVKNWIGGPKNGND